MSPEPVTETQIVASKGGGTNDKDLRILIFTAAYFVLDGVTLTIRRIESHLRSRGAIVKICTTAGEDLDAEQMKDVILVPGIKIPLTAAGSGKQIPIYLFNTHFIALIYMCMIGYALGVGLDAETIKKLEEFNPNCVHFTVPDFVALDGIRWCQSRNIAYMGTWHSNYVDYLKYYNLDFLLAPTVHRFLKSFYQQMPSVYVPTPYMLGRLREWKYDTCTELHEWGRGIDLKLFSPQRRSNAFRASKGIADTDIIVLWVGRLVPEKRVDIWMNVVSKLQSEGLPVKALVVGNGTYVKALSQLHHVTCCGWLSGEALAEAYASSDVLLFPSDVETFGNVTLEALASGCTCVVERKCGEHLVQHGSNGFTCEAGDFNDFYEATKRIVTETAMRKKMAHNARVFSWKYERNVILQQMLENYKVLTYTPYTYTTYKPDIDTLHYIILIYICMCVYSTRSSNSATPRSSRPASTTYRRPRDATS